MLRKINSIGRDVVDKGHFLIIIFVTFALPLSLEQPHFIWHGDDIFFVNDIERNFVLQNWLPYYEIAGSRRYLSRFYSLFYYLLNGNEQVLALINLSLRSVSSLLLFFIIKKFLESNFQSILLVLVWFFQAQYENNFEYAGFLYNLVILLLFIIILLYIDIKNKTYLKMVILACLILLSLNLYEILAPLTIIPILVAFFRIIQFRLSSITFKNIIISCTPLMIFLYHTSYMGNYFNRNPSSPNFISVEAPFHFIRVILAGLNLNFGYFGIERARQGFERFTNLLQETDFLVVNIIAFVAITLIFFKILKYKNINSPQRLGKSFIVYLIIIACILSLYILYVTGIIDFNISQLLSTTYKLNTTRLLKAIYVLIVCLVFFYLIKKLKEKKSDLSLSISEYEIGIVGILFILLGYTVAFKMVDPFPKDIPLRLTLIAQIGVTLVLIPFAKSLMNMSQKVFNIMILLIIVLNYTNYSQDYYNFNRQTSNYLKLSEYVLDASKIYSVKIPVDSRIVFDLTEFNFDTIDKKYFMYDSDQYAIPKHLYNVLLNKFDKENDFVGKHVLATEKGERDIYTYFTVCIIYPGGKGEVCHSTQETVVDKVFLIASS